MNIISKGLIVFVLSLSLGVFSTPNPVEASTQEAKVIGSIGGFLVGGYVISSYLPLPVVPSVISSVAAAYVLYRYNGKVDDFIDRRGYGPIGAGVTSAVASVGVLAASKGCFVMLLKLLTL